MCIEKGEMYLLRVSLQTLKTLQTHHGVVKATTLFSAVEGFAWSYSKN